MGLEVSKGKGEWRSKEERLYRASWAFTQRDIGSQGKFGAGEVCDVILALRTVAEGVP